MSHQASSVHGVDALGTQEMRSWMGTQYDSRKESAPSGDGREAWREESTLLSDDGASGGVEDAFTGHGAIRSDVPRWTMPRGAEAWGAAFPL